MHPSLFTNQSFQLISCQFKNYLIDFALKEKEKKKIEAREVGMKVGMKVGEERDESGLVHGNSIAKILNFGGKGPMDMGCL